MEAGSSCHSMASGVRSYEASMGPKVVRVGLVESHTLFRDAIRTLLNESGEILVVGEASDAAGVLAMITEQKPDALLFVMNGNAEHALSVLSRISDIADQ